MVLECVWTLLYWPCVLLLPDPGRSSWSWSDTWTGDSSPGNDPGRREQTGRLGLLLLLRILLHGVLNRYCLARITTTDRNRPASSHWHLSAANHRNLKREVVTPALDTHFKPVPVKTQVQRACTGGEASPWWLVLPDRRPAPTFFHCHTDSRASVCPEASSWCSEKGGRQGGRLLCKACNFISVTLNINVFWRLGCWR